MSAIWKYPLLTTSEQRVTMPEGSTPLHVDYQHGTLCLWALVHPGNTSVQQIVHIYGTGHPFDADIAQAHIGSVQIGPLVWHAFWVVD